MALLALLEELQIPATFFCIGERVGLGAFAFPLHFLNLTDYEALDELRVAHEKVKLVVESEGDKIPSNGAKENGIYLYRPLNYLAMKMVHKLKEESALEAYDSIYGMFIEGQDLFSGSGLKAKSHVQIAIQNLECIAGCLQDPDFP